MITWRLVVEQILNGLVSGCMYAVVASGLTLIWGTMKMLNFAHGEFYMIGGYILYFSMTVFGIPPIYGLLLAIAVTFALGLLIERVIIHPLLDKPEWEVSAFVATLGISIFFQNMAQKIWGERFKSVPYFLKGVLDIYGFRVAYQRVFIFTVTAVVMLALWGFIKKAKFGLGLRATAQDRDAATLVGINAKRIYTMTFGMSCAMAALAASLLAPIFLINPWMGHAALLKGFITVVLGGLGSFEGAILGGVLLGTVESLTVIFISSEWKDVVAFVMLILVLVIRPSGLFGMKEW
jgi:branched-chain amino acid transport system permease protein